MPTNQTFTIPVQGDKQAMLKTVRDLILEANGDFQGDTISGKFSTNTPFGIIEGNYKLDQSDIGTVRITQKPFLVPYETIREAIVQCFALAASNKQR